MTRLLDQAEKTDMPSALVDTLKPKSMAEQFVLVTLNEALSDYGIALLLEMVDRVACDSDDDEDGEHR